MLIFFIIVELDKLIAEEENQNKSMKNGFYDDIQNDTNFNHGNILNIISPFLYYLFYYEKHQVFNNNNADEDVFTTGEENQNNTMEFGFSHETTSASSMDAGKTEKKKIAIDIHLIKFI